MRKFKTFKKLNGEYAKLNEIFSSRFPFQIHSDFTQTTVITFKKL